MSVLKWLERYIWCLLGACVWLGLSVWPASAQTEPPLLTDPGGRLPHPEQVLPWLDEVRAQRRAWEEDLRQRRAERQERIEQERAAFRRLGPEPWSGWSFATPWLPSSEPTAPPGHLPLHPPDWDNLWYFRGY
ncbi:hypothetical protein GWK36_04120 [Caldichromatium japonicum]|uniref:Uncharacterized protein n=1 Tax=Caldichromatium japonicum TaxID=2699430 RepID=A0A6G7VBI5_9GAMM|nr:hypothetical protein [Caldichromatium japonicum]QIK37312.1 hypothetical protein GWK36_04120 [Caldichromatium japonicum]